MFIYMSRIIIFIQYWMQTREKRKNVNMLYLKILKRNNKMIFTLFKNAESNIVPEK